MNKLFISLTLILITQSVLADMSCDTDINKYFAVYERNNYDCAPGYYLPANTDGCRICDVFGKSCPGGTYTFNETENQGLVVATYTCASGQYLPANIDGCRACTYGHTCPGGTYTFNENENQGLVIGSYTCNSGYFLPANSDTCRACPTGYTCSGGTFTFNTNEYQGAELNNVSTTTMNNVCAANFPIKLFAVYEPNTITINWDDGTNTTQNTCVYGQSITLPPTPTRPGYVFAGWKVKNQN